MLLEAYFVQIDGTLNKLSTVCLQLDRFILSQSRVNPETTTFLDHINESHPIGNMSHSALMWSTIINLLQLKV